MRFQLTDRYALDAGAKVRPTDDGYLVAAPRVARTGIQLYRGSEVGKPTMDIVRVYRPEAEVFQKDSMHTFAHKPITDDHPPEMVDASNWKKYAKGQSGDEVARDGEFLRVPMVLMDADTIKKFDAGKAELSVGYFCDIKWGEGTTPDGQTYDATQTGIIANHIAVVDAARGGKELRIGDGTGETRLNADALSKGLIAISKGNISLDQALADADAHLARDGKGDAGYPFMKDGSVNLISLRAAKVKAIAKGDGDILAAVDSMLSQIETATSSANDSGHQEGSPNMKVHIIDGISVEMSDVAVQVVDKHIAALKSAAADLQTKLDAANAAHAALKTQHDADTAKSATEASTKDAEIVTLKKQLEDAKLSPQKLDALVADRKVTADKAKIAMGDKAASLIVDGKTDAEIRKQVVDAKVGEVAKGWTDEQIKVSFDSLTAGIDLAKANDTAAQQQHFNRPGGLRDQSVAFSHAPADSASESDKRYDARDARLTNAWKNEPATKQ